MLMAIVDKFGTPECRLVSSEEPGYEKRALAFYQNHYRACGVDPSTLSIKRFDHVIDTKRSSGDNPHPLKATALGATG